MYRKRFVEMVGWDNARRQFVAELRELNVAKVINQLPMKLKACVDAHGGHVEEALASLKRMHD